MGGQAIRGVGGESISPMADLPSGLSTCRGLAEEKVHERFPRAVGQYRVLPSAVRAAHLVLGPQDILIHSLTSPPKAFLIAARQASSACSRYHHSQLALSHICHP